LIIKNETPILITCYSLDKGRTKLDYAELLRLSAKATVYDQVHFDKMLTELKDQP
jgi:hypothetical protein